MSKGVLLVDSASQYYRAFHGVPSSVRAPDGSPVNAVRGFYAGLTRLIETTGLSRLVLAWDDDWRPAFRTNLIPEYKLHRVAADGTEETPPELGSQVELIAALAQAMGIARIGVPGFEADDVIATIAAAEPGPAVVVTGDRDLFQVIDDQRDVKIWYTGRGSPDPIGGPEVLSRYGVRADQYADFAILRGDPSDGLPGVKGIGEKSAAGLLAKFGDLAGVTAAAADPTSAMSAGVRQALLGSADYLERAVAVVRVRVDVPLPHYSDGLSSEVRDPDSMARLTARTGLANTFERWRSVVAQATAE